MRFRLRWSLSNTVVVLRIPAVSGSDHSQNNKAQIRTLGDIRGEVKEADYRLGYEANHPLPDALNEAECASALSTFNRLHLQRLFRQEILYSCKNNTHQDTLQTTKCTGA